MQKAKKRIYAAFVCTLFIFSLSCFGFSANAAESTLGTQAPAITAAYTDSSGEPADGGSLTSGTYQMVLTVSDLSCLSQMEFTAAYNTEVLSIGSCTALPGASEELMAVGPKTANGAFIFGIISKNAECTQLADNSLTLLTMEITVTSDVPVNMNQVMDVSKDPNFTFIEVNYNDRVLENDVYVYNCYALGTADNFAGRVCSMSCDLAPAIPKGYTVSAYIGALSAPEDTEGKYATTGAVVSITTADGSVISATTGDDGKFVLEGVPTGDYTATVTYMYGFDRTFTIKVGTSDVTSTAMVGIVACNWDGNSTVNINDYAKYAVLVGSTPTSENYDVGINLDRNSTINVNDYAIYARFVGKTPTTMTYADTTVS